MFPLALDVSSRTPLSDLLLSLDLFAPLGGTYEVRYGTRRLESYVSKDSFWKMLEAVAGSSGLTACFESNQDATQCRLQAFGIV